MWKELLSHDMPNWCFSEVRVVGEPEGVHRLFLLMKGLEEMERPFVDNDFGTAWYGNLVHLLGGNYRDFHCRGHWMDLKLENAVLRWVDMAAWGPVIGVFELIEKAIPGLKVYFTAEEEGCDVFVTNDAEGRFFTARYILSTEVDWEYFDDLDSLLKHASMLCGRNITTIEQLWDVINELDDWWLHEFEII